MGRRRRHVLSKRRQNKGKGKEMEDKGQLKTVKKENSRCKIVILVVNGGERITEKRSFGAIGDLIHT